MTKDELALNGFDLDSAWPDPASEAETIERDWWIRCRYTNGMNVDPSDLMDDRWRFKPRGVDWPSWLEAPEWTPIEAACLALGLSPFISANARTVDTEEMLQHVLRRISNSPPRTPAEWVQALVDIGYDDLPPPMFGLLDDERATRGYHELRALALSRRPTSSAP